MSKSYNVDIAKFPGYLAPHDSFAIFTPICQIAPLDNLGTFKNNRRFQQFLTEGVNVTYQVDNQTFHEKIWLIDRFNLKNNDWLVIHPFTISEENNTHVIDVIVFINGLPLAVIICTQPDNRNPNLTKAYQILQIYKQQNLTLFSYNTFIVITNDNQARVGTLTSEWKDFFTWRSIDGEDFPAKGETELEVLIQGIFDKRRFFELVKHFIVFQEHEVSMSKNLLRYPFCTMQNHMR